MISLVIPIYNEEVIVGPLVDQVRAAMESLAPRQDW